MSIGSKINFGNFELSNNKSMSIEAHHFLLSQRPDELICGEFLTLKSSKIDQSLNLEALNFSSKKQYQQNSPLPVKLTTVPPPTMRLPCCRKNQFSLWQTTRNCLNINSTRSESLKSFASHKNRFFTWTTNWNYVVLVLLKLNGAIKIYSKTIIHLSFVEMGKFYALKRPWN